MDCSTLLLLYNNVIYDFKGLFSIRRIFCLGLVTGMSIMDGINRFFEFMNPDKLPLDYLDEHEEGGEAIKIYQKQLKVSHNICNRYIYYLILNNLNRKFSVKPSESFLSFVNNEHCGARVILVEQSTMAKSIKFLAYFFKS